MANTRDFLLEIGCEEMPSAPLNNAVAQLEPLIAKGLDEAGLAHGGVRVISSPRRLAVLVSALAEATEAVSSIMRGPSAAIAFDVDGNPTRAAEGFARKFGLTAADLVRRADTDGTEYVFAERNVPSKPAQPILTNVCESLIAAIQWPNYRSQRWGSERATFVRPVRWICCLFGDESIPVRYADVESAPVTRGHRVLAPGNHAVPSADSYEQVLESAFVLPAERREEVIRAGIARIEAELGVRVDTPSKVFEEVVNLCEWPSVLVGHFDEEFLAVPSEIICESMLSNQRYFPTYDAAGKLTRAFVVVSNADPAVSATVVDGNERVVRARLYDAKFFYDEDLKVPLEQFRERLAAVGFQKKLGTVLQKSERMEDLALACARAAHLGAHAASDAQRAAHLAKADLVSSAVIEFTSQQGVMGGYYAAAAGEAPEVAAAIRDHYRPRFAGDELPAGAAGCVVRCPTSSTPSPACSPSTSPPRLQGPLRAAPRRDRRGEHPARPSGLRLRGARRRRARRLPRAGGSPSTRTRWRLPCAPSSRGRMEQMARDERVPPEPWLRSRPAPSPSRRTSSRSPTRSTTPARTIAPPSRTSPPPTRAPRIWPTPRWDARSTSHSWAMPSAPCWRPPTRPAMRSPPPAPPRISRP